MIHSITDWILNLMHHHGAMSVFIGVIIESVIVPIPSPLIIMGAGTILIPPELSFLQAVSIISLKIVIPGAIASTIGAYFGYALGYWGGRPLIDRMKSFLGFGWENVLLMEKRFVEGKIGVILFFLRALPIVPLSLISVAAGTIRMPLSPFTLWTFVGSIPRCLFLGLIGWLMHDSYLSIAKSFNFVEGLVSGLIVISAIGLVVYLRNQITRV